MEIIQGGTATMTDIDGFLAWYRELNLAESKDIRKRLIDASPDKGKGYVDAIGRTIAKMFQVTSWASYPPSETEEAKWPVQRDAVAQDIERFLRFAQDFNQPLQVGYWAKGIFAYLYLGNPNEGVIVAYPELYLTYVPAPDYSDMTAADVRAALNAPRTRSEKTLVPENVETNLTRNSLTSAMEKQKTEEQRLLQEIDDVKNARTKELAETQAKIAALHAELQAQKDALMAELNDKMRELRAKKEQMEGQIYLLDAQIYAIRCFAGEVVKFAQIRSGKNAPDTEPVVIHQKLRFLDEDLGRLASLYEIQWEDISMFEEFLRHSPLALDTFAPNERCVMLVRLSRNGVQKGVDGERPYSNVLRNYTYFHGKTVGIIIRNGENLYIGWTDEKRIKIDDDLIISQVVTSVEPAEQPEFYSEFAREQAEQQKKEEAKQFLDGILSRTFVYNILQGIVERSSLLPLPPGASLGAQSEYVIYAVADKWLTDNRFGSFPDIIKKCNQRVQPGDMLLTTQRLVAERYYSRTSGYASRTWENVRGRGDRNRTHDVEAADCTLYPANLVEYDEPVPMVRYRVNNGAEETAPKRYFEREYGSQTNVEILEEYETKKRHVFVSLEKKDNWLSQRLARANFELYDDEFINLTYMNSVWLEWVINNKTLGNWRVGGVDADYAFAIRYLKTAMDFIRQREAEEKAAIDAIDTNVCKDPNWPLKLTEWKLEHKVRAITPFQAKRFVQTYNN